MTAEAHTPCMRFVFMQEAFMETRYPAYYPQFHCIAAACPDSCCKDWAVAVDPAAASMYRALPGELGSRLREALTEEDGETILALTPEGRCPMWRADGLCALQARHGEQALCEVCRSFPRLRHDYGSFTELGLELSCPEAARLILSASGELVSKTVPGGDAPDYDEDAMSVLLAGRAQLLSLLDAPRFSPGEALAVMLLHGYHMQEALDGGEDLPFDPEAALEEARRLALPGGEDAFLRFFGSLEILTPDWKRRLAVRERAPWSPQFRALARYGVCRYYLQAVSDYDLVGRVKLVVCSCLLVRALGGDILRTAQLYSKEVENDPDNVCAILDGAYTAPALADRMLLGLALDGL